MKAKLVVELRGKAAAVFPPGTIIDHPDAYRLVRHGCADPADEECRLKANMTRQQLLKAQATYPKVAAGLHPDDYDAWDRGYMRGYNPDGSWKPGPNYDEFREQEAERRAEDAGIILP